MQAIATNIWQTNINKYIKGFMFHYVDKLNLLISNTLIISKHLIYQWVILIK